MMRFFKQRWVIAALAVVATLLFIQYVYPKIKKASPGSSTPPANANPVASTPVVQSLKSRLVGPVSASAN